MTKEPKKPVVTSVVIKLRPHIEGRYVSLSVFLGRDPFTLSLAGSVRMHSREFQAVAAVLAKGGRVLSGRFSALLEVENLPDSRTRVEIMLDPPDGDYAGFVRSIQEAGIE